MERESRNKTRAHRDRHPARTPNSHDRRSRTIRWGKQHQHRVRDEGHASPKPERQPRFPPECHTRCTSIQIPTDQISTRNTKWKSTLVTQALERENRVRRLASVDWVFVRCVVPIAQTHDPDGVRLSSCIRLDKSYDWVAEPSKRIRIGLPPLGLEVCGGHPDLPFTLGTRDGFPDFDGGNLLVFVDHVFEFRAEPALRNGGLCAGSAEAAYGPFEVIVHVRVPTAFV